MHTNELQSNDYWQDKVVISATSNSSRSSSSKYCVYTYRSRPDSRHEEYFRTIYLLVRVLLDVHSIGTDSDPATISATVYGLIVVIVSIYHHVMIGFELLSHQLYYLT